MSRAHTVPTAIVRPMTPREPRYVTRAQMLPGGVVPSAPDPPPHPETVSDNQLPPPPPRPPPPLPPPNPDTDSENSPSAGNTPDTANIEELYATPHRTRHSDDVTVVDNDMHSGGRDGDESNHVTEENPYGDDLEDVSDWVAMGGSTRPKLPDIIVYTADGEGEPHVYVNQEMVE